MLVNTQYSMSSCACSAVSVWWLVVLACVQLKFSVPISFLSLSQVSGVSSCCRDFPPLLSSIPFPLHTLCHLLSFVSCQFFTLSLFCLSFSITRINVIKTSFVFDYCSSSSEDSSLRPDAFINSILILHVNSD